MKNDNNKLLLGLNSDLEAELKKNTEYKEFSNCYPSLITQLKEEIKPDLVKIGTDMLKDQNMSIDNSITLIDSKKGFEVYKTLRDNKKHFHSIYKTFSVDRYIKEFESLEKQKSEAIKKNKWAGDEKRKFYKRAERLKQMIICNLKLEQEDMRRTLILDKKNEMLLKLSQTIIERIKKFFLLSEINPDTGMFGSLWDLTKGKWNKNILLKLMEWKAKVENDPKLKQLVKMIGRSRSYSEFSYELTKTLRRSTSIKYENHYKEELEEITQGDDLNSLLSSELVLLNDPDTEIIFFKKFAEKKLNIYSYKNAETIDIVEEGLENKKKDDNKVQQGPVIICMDTSGSMASNNHLPENVAKALTFSIILKAAAENRSVFLINFSTGIQTTEFIKGSYDLEDLTNFLSMSFNGGTDVLPALNEGIRKIGEQEFEDADILLVSDFVMNKLPGNILSKMEEVRKKGTQFLGLVISSERSPVNIDNFDKTWSINVNDPKELRLIER